jgi:hypothetical protein
LATSSPDARDITGVYNAAALADSAISGRPARSEEATGVRADTAGTLVTPVN